MTPTKISPETRGTAIGGASKDRAPVFSVAYDEQGYQILRSATPAAIASALLGLIQRDLSATPERFAKLLARPSVNSLPAYEFYGMQYAPVMAFHWGLTVHLRELTGLALLPSYSYFRVYQKNDVCYVHSDREACEHSMSLALAYSDNVVWPFQIGRRRYEFSEACELKFEGDFGSECRDEIDLRPGDGILYRGVNYRHGRTSPNPNRWSAHLFLHWVDSEGPFRDWAFDKQPRLKFRDFEFPPRA